jgi:acetaldehyde dehydrogenase / alcohol dehydrogenase
VIDETIYDAMIDEFRRMGARVLSEEETAALAAKSFTDDGRVEMQVLGQSCVNLGALAGFDTADADKVLLAPVPSDLDALAAHPFIAEKLMRVLGVVRSPSVEHAIRSCELVTEHDGLGHTSALYASDDDVIERFALAIRTGRILVNAPTAVGALGGVYNSMTPTFSLGCGTWGGSNTTDNVKYRSLLNIKAVSRRQLRRSGSGCLRTPTSIRGRSRTSGRCLLLGRSSLPTRTARLGASPRRSVGTWARTLCACSRGSSPRRARPRSAR